MDSLKPLNWSQGLFLKPQHFQQSDNYNTAVSKLYSQIKTGIDAGISDLKFDMSALKSGLLNIEKLLCILDDGSLVSFPGNCQIAPFTLDVKHADESGKIEVYLGLAPVSIEQSNLASAVDPSARFLAAKDISKKDLFDSNE